MRRFLGPLLLVFVLAGCTSGENKGYPEAYLLRGEEIPSGLQLGPVPTEIPAGTNPYEVPPPLIAEVIEGLKEEFGDVPIPEPDELWVESFLVQGGDPEQDKLYLFAALWNDAGKADAFAQALKQFDQGVLCTQEDAELLQKGGVLVFVLATSTSAQAYVDKVSDQVEKDSGASDVCD